MTIIPSNKRRVTGDFVSLGVGGEEVRLYIPRPLPPVPALELTPDDLDKLERANRALGRLDGVAQLLPDPDLFLYFYIRKEAVLSLYFKQNRSRYYDLLQRVRTDGDWESWVRFFLEGVEETAVQAVHLATQIRQLFATDRERLSKIGRAAGSALRVHDLFQRRPMLTVAMATKKLSLSAPTVRASMQALEEAGIVRELSGKRRDRLFGYQRYLDLMASDTRS